ncbi:MAG: helix-turn-helix domain-containing protein, partial [Pseudomonadota bacterium]
YEFDTSNLDSDGIVSWYANVSPGIRMNQVSESATAALVRGMRTLTGRAIRPISVSFHHLRSTNLDVFERFFGCPVKFGEPRSALSLKQADLDLPLITQDERLHSILRDVCNRILAERETRPASITRRVEQYISEHIENGWPSQDSVARNLGMSSRTLARRLAEEGTSFRSVSNVLREDLATSYVRESPLPLTEVAFVLGYNDVSAFSTAFHRWTGQSPSHFRHAAGRS